MARIDDFEILAKLGEGGMGTVFKAHQVSLDRIVALKVLAPKLAQNPALVARFLREARATAKLNHPNIVAGIAVGSEAGYNYFAMEMIEGETFKKRIHEKGSLPEAEVLRVGAAMASALAHAHAAGIVHRDVKPDNILIDREGTPKLADLGLAKAETAEDASLTQSGTTLGTPHYMAPEQAAGEANIDGRADTYALGCTLYHAATGQTPFDAPSMGLLMVKHINERMTHPQSIKPELSDAFCLILSRMVARERQDRYANLNDAAADMEAVLNGGAPKCTPLPAAKSKFTAAPVPAQGVTKGERMATRRHPPVEGDRASTRRQSGVEGSRESKRRIVLEPKKSGSAMPLAIAGGGVLLVGVLVIAMSGGAKPASPAPEEKKPKLAQAPSAPPRPAVPTTVSSVSSEHNPAAQTTPETRPAERQPVIVSAPRPAAATVETPSLNLTPVRVASSDPPAPRAEPPSNGEGTSLFNGRDLSDWHIQNGNWRLENGSMIGTGDDKNISNWKYNCLPLDFDLTFTSEDGDNGFHFGWMARDRTIYVQFEADGLLHLTYYITESIELKRAAANYNHGKHAWRVIVRKTSVQIFVDGALAVACDNVEQSLDRDRDVCFFAHPHNTLRISQLSVRAASSGVGEPAKAPAAKPAENPEFKAQIEAQTAYATFGDEFLGALRKFDSKGAAALLDRAEKDAALAALLPQLKQDRRMIALLEQLCSAELNGARKLTEVDDFELIIGRSSPQHVGKKTQARITGVEKGNILIDMGGAGIQPNVTQLAPETRLKLVELGLSADAALDRATLALLRAKNSGDTKGLALAHDTLETARKSSGAGSEIDCLEHWLRIIEEGAKDTAAAASWPNIKALADQQQWPAFRQAASEFLKTYDKTRFAESKRAEIDMLLKAAVNEPEEVGLSPDEQLKRLMEKIKAANPGFGGHTKARFEGGKPVEIHITAPSLELRDLNPFRSVPSLKILLLNSERTSPLSDLSPLKGMQLTHLEIVCSSVKDLTPLGGMPLTWLNISTTPVTDLSPLKGAPLTHLDMPGSHCTDLSPLRGCPLKELQCYGIAGFTDLTPLQDLPLETLNCSWNAITDLKPLANLPLKTLCVDNVKTDDISPLKNLKLELIRFDYKPGAHDTLLRNMTTLQTINGFTPAEFFKRAADGTLPK